MQKPENWAWMTHQEQKAWESGHSSAEAQADYVPVAEACCDDEDCEWTTYTIPCHDLNPKDIAGSEKCPLWLIPPAAEEAEAWAMKHGAHRYGPWNWRQQPIHLSSYISAIRRHLAAFMDREEADADSGLSHLAHARATLGILLDAKANGVLIDDRPERGR
jgi:hypothetical protein